MLLLTDSNVPRGFWSFPGRPQQQRSDPGWRDHPRASAVEALLIERGLEDGDIELFVDEEALWVVTACWPHQLWPQERQSGHASAMDRIVLDLDHLVAWRRREVMIAATLGTSDEGVLWVTSPSRGSRGTVGPATGNPLGDAVPLWAVTASTVLLGHLTRGGVSPLEALRLACARPCDPDCDDTWIDIDGVRIRYGEGRLHAREFVDELTVDDFFGVTLNIGSCSLPETAIISAIGRPLADIVAFDTRPTMLYGIDPVVSKLRNIGPGTTHATRAGLLMTLDNDTETLADVPFVALAAIGDPRRQVVHSAKPWLRS